MKIVFNVYPRYLEKHIYRKIEVDDSIKLTDFCEYIIISMNGSCKYSYYLKNDINNNIYIPYKKYDSDISGKRMDNLKLCDIKIPKNGTFSLSYGGDSNIFWCFDIEVEKTYKSKDNVGFKVLDGTGVGIIEDRIACSVLHSLLNNEVRKEYIGHFIERIKGYEEWKNSEFTVDSNNLKIEEYKKKQIELLKPKKYIFNIRLEGFEKIIKRKIAVSGDIPLDTFCKCIVRSMNGDLDHLYTIKRGKECIDSGIINGRNLNFLEFKEKQKFIVIYDFGDDWHFKVSVSKITDEELDKKFEVLKAVGKGIQDDCGGTWGLAPLINNPDNDWDYNINDYNLDEINEDLSKLI